MLEIHSSALLKKYLIFITFLSMLAVFYASIELYIQLLLLALIIFIFAFQLKSLTATHRLVWLQDNNWQIYSNATDHTDAYLTLGSFLSSWLVILALKTETGKRVNILVPYDALSSDAFRRLKLRLTILKPKYLKGEGADRL